MRRSRSCSTLVLLLMLVVALFPPAAFAQQPTDCGGIDFDPGNGGVSGQVNVVGVDLNELYGEPHPFVAHGNTVVYAGEHYVPYSHLFISTDQIGDLQENLAYRKYIVTDANDESRTYVCDDDQIATTWDQAHGDVLTCGDFFPGSCEFFGMTADTGMVAWLPKLPPLPPGHWVVELVLRMEHDQVIATGFIPAGEWTQVVFEFDVLPGNRPRT